MGKSLPANTGNKRAAVRCLGREDPLEEGTATHPVFLPAEPMICVLISFVHFSTGLSLLIEEWEFYRGTSSLLIIGTISTFSQFFF